MTILAFGRKPRLIRRLSGRCSLYNQAMSSAGHGSKQAQLAQNVGLIVDAIPTLAWSARSDGSADFFNQRWLDYTGLSAEEARDWGWTLALHPDDEKGLVDYWRSVLASGKPGEIEARMRRVDGVYRWFLFRATPSLDNDGRVIKWFGTNTDIEDRKRAEDALRSNERNLRLILDTIPGFVCILSEGGKVELVNRQVLEYFGKTIEELKNWDTSDVVHPDDLPRVIEAWKHSVETGEPYALELRQRRADGVYRWFQARALPAKDTQGRITGWHMLLTDIDDRRRAEDAVRSNEQSLRLMVDSIPGFVSTANAAGEIELVNRQVLGYFGKTIEELKNWDTSDAVHPDDLPRMVEAYRRAFETGEPLDVENRSRRADGVYRWFHVRARPQRDAEGRIVRWCSLVTDIDDRKRAEALLAAEKRTLEMITSGACLADILERLCESIDAQASNIKSAIMLMDADCMHLRPAAGPRLAKGWIEAITPLKIGPCIGSCGSAAFLKQRMIVSDVATDPLWVDFRDLALSYGLRAAWSQPLLSKNQEVLGTFCLYYSEPRTPSETDLRLIEGAGHIAVIAIEGERSQVALTTAFDEIAKSEAELRRITDAIPQTIAVLGTDGKNLYANQALLDYTGLTSEEVMAPDFRERVFHPEDVARLRPERQKALERGIPFQNEQRARRKDGQYRWFLVQYNPLRDEQGKVIRWYATGTDIEDRKQAEERTREENVALREQIDQVFMFEEIVGSSPALKTVLSGIVKVAPTESTVLISGETGTGKELIARAIHKSSQRAGHAFIAVNCASIPASLIASELFGHEKGAFTGALQRRQGRFELAHSGTIFLDEIGELPAETQIALLRVIQERQFERVGGSRVISTDVRIVAATNRDLAAAIASGTFRADLFYRLNVFPIHVPPLRNRKEDIPMLVEYFVKRYAEKASKQITKIDKNTLKLCQSYSWPGNIRELQNIVERSVILCTGDTFWIDEAWLSSQEVHRPGSSGSLAQTLESHEKELIEEALRESNGKVAGPNGAAAKLGIPRSTLDAKIKQLKITKYTVR
jgi:PAS domain S-box-containing protein